MSQGNPPAVPADKLYQQIRQLIESAKAHVVTQVNQALALTYWQIGKTIKTEVLDDGRAQYGAATMDSLAKKLVAEYGQGFGRRNLFRMAKFYQQFPDIEIVTTVSAQLSWSHFVEIIKIDDAIKREFYIRMQAGSEEKSCQIPSDFMFELTENEIAVLVSQSVIPSRKHLEGVLM